MTVIVHPISRKVVVSHTPAPGMLSGLFDIDFLTAAPTAGDVLVRLPSGKWGPKTPNQIFDDSFGVPSYDPVTGILQLGFTTPWGIRPDGSAYFEDDPTVGPTPGEEAVLMIEETGELLLVQPGVA